MVRRKFVRNVLMFIQKEKILTDHAGHINQHEMEKTTFIDVVEKQKKKHQDVK